MKSRANRSHPWTRPGLWLGLAAALIPACENDSGGQSPDPTSEITTYAGTWTQNGTSGTFDATKSLAIAMDLSYSQTVRQYESTDKLTLAWTKTVEATVTDIDVSEHNDAYETLIIDIDEVRVTPETADQAAAWNASAYGGVTTWVPQTTRTFDSSHPGPWEHGTVWLSHVAVSMLREGDLLNVNERGGFDGEDPPEDVYFLED